MKIKIANMALIAVVLLSLGSNAQSTGPKNVQPSEGAKKTYITNNGQIINTDPTPNPAYTNSGNTGSNNPDQSQLVWVLRDSIANLQKQISADSTVLADSKKDSSARYAYLLYGGGDLDPHNATGSPFGGVQFQVNWGWGDLGFSMDNHTIYRKRSDDSIEVNKFYTGGFSLSILTVPYKYNKHFAGTGVGVQLNVLWDNYKAKPVFPVMAGWYIKAQYNLGKIDKRGLSYFVGLKTNLMVANYRTPTDNSKAAPVIYGAIMFGINIHNIKFAKK